MWLIKRKLNTFCICLKDNVKRYNILHNGKGKNQIPKNISLLIVTMKFIVLSIKIIMELLKPEN